MPPIARPEYDYNKQGNEVSQNLANAMSNVGHLVQNISTLGSCGDPSRHIVGKFGGRPGNTYFRVDSQGVAGNYVRIAYQVGNHTVAQVHVHQSVLDMSAVLATLRYELSWSLEEGRISIVDP